MYEYKLMWRKRYLYSFYVSLWICWSSQWDRLQPDWNCLKDCVLSSVGRGINMFSNIRMLKGSNMIIFGMMRQAAQTYVS